jgi:hypothetical protein
MPKVTRITIEALSNIIDVCKENFHGALLWSTFCEHMPPPFSTEDLFYLTYEPDRNIFCVEKRGGICEQGLSGIGPEMSWVANNVDKIIETVKQHHAS